MSGQIWLGNRQRCCSVNTALLRRMARHLLATDFELKAYELGVLLVEDAEMTRLNENFLRHAGSTDVISFNYNEALGRERLQGEIFICLEEARRQARRYHTSWQAELARYLVHGVLHLQGFDDLKPAERRRMKREEDRLVQELEMAFGLCNLQKRRPAKQRFS
jgi:probable rRNA maturation factor